jgi:hypothetical protein
MRGALARGVAKAGQAVVGTSVVDTARSMASLQQNAYYKYDVKAKKAFVENKF